MMINRIRTISIGENRDADGGPWWHVPVANIIRFSDIDRADGTTLVEYRRGFDGVALGYCLSADLNYAFYPAEECDPNDTEGERGFSTPRPTDLGD